MKLKITILMLAFAGVFSAFAQDQDNGPNYVGELIRTGVKESINSRTNLPGPKTKIQIMKDGRAKVRKAKVEVVPGKGLEEDALANNPNQLENRVPTRMPDLVFDAVSSGSQPTDPSLAIGPDDVVVVFNTGIVFYDKAGNLKNGPVGPGAIFADTDVCCDLTVSYDNAADRWVLTILSSTSAGNSRNLLQIAISDGPDPTTSNWVTYEIQENSDYQKLSIYGDGYYMTNNGTTDVFAMERDAMLAGDPTASIQGFAIPGFFTSGFASPQFLNVSDDNVPAPGNAPLVFLQDNAYSGVSVDHIKFWNLSADFDTPSNSSISTPQEIPVTAFTSVFDGGSFANLTQPNGGGALDALQGIIMNQAQFRKLPTYNSAVFNHVVDVASGAAETAAVRWYEFRQPAEGQPWSLFQEGTYTSPDGKDAWNASLIMDNQGNIGMGYTGMGGTNDIEASSYFTGRLATDPPGTMTMAETLIAQGDGPIPGGGAGTRYGDYSKIDVDPTDDQTFWFINEYHGPNTPSGQRSNVVGRFQIAPDTDNDTGVVAIVQPEDGALTATETVQVMIRNFGINDQSNIPVSFTVDGGTPVSETFTGTITSGATEMYTFTGTADLSTEGQTYTIAARTSLSGDEGPNNDETTKDITHLNDIDTGVAAITSPTSGEGLTATEDVTVTIQNFGAVTQTSIPVFYNLDGGTNVTETYTGSIAQGDTDTYTFTVAADLSGFQDYTIVAGTDLSGDQDATNDDTTVQISNQICQPNSNCSQFNDGVTQLTLADQDINVNCSATGYSDDTSTIFNFVLNNNPFQGTLQVGFADSEYAIWIDFNDNNVFEASEIVSNELVATAGSDFNFTIDFTNFSGVTPGMYRMRVRGEDESTTGDVTDPCGDLAFGRTNDYTANITGTLGIEDSVFSESEMVITSTDNKIFELNLTTSSYTDRLPVLVYNMLGQKLAYYTLENDGNGYSKTIDMSYVNAGIYFVKVGGDSVNKVQRIIVK